MATHDYNIANASGSAVRTDLNNVLAAIVSNNSNATEPATTYAYQWWADTTANVLKLRNAANDAWVEIIQLDGEFTSIGLEDGSAASPSLFFRDSGTDTGLFSPAADEVAISTGGTQRVTVKSGGNIGVATLDPTQSSLGGSALSGSGRVVTIQGNAAAGARCLALASDDGSGDLALQVVDRTDYSSQNFVIYGDGSVENTTGSIGTLSDIRFKSNIQPAASQWADIKDIEIVNYDLNGEERRLLGVVAQQVETVSPGLVVDRIKCNENGEEIDSIKGVRTSILYMKAVKALQEAIERIETLEAKVAALEAQ